MRSSILAVSVLFTLISTHAMAIEAPKPAPAAGERSSYFKKLDQNGDAAISKDEWRAHGDSIFSAIDSNRDGKLSAEEMKAHYAAKRAEREARKNAAPAAK